jgi:hypothetical protein
MALRPLETMNGVKKLTIPFRKISIADNGVKTCRYDYRQKPAATITVDNLKSLACQKAAYAITGS